MIAKLETGNGFKGALRYDVRAGKGTAKELARVLDADGVSCDFDDKGNLLINPKQVSFDFRQQTMGYVGPGTIRKPVYHWVLSYHPDDKVSEYQMVLDGKEFLKRIDFCDTQFVMTVHYDKKHHHLHILTNIVNNQGQRIPTKGLIDNAHAAAAAITKDRGYTWGERTKKENITKENMHKPHERAREIVEPMIREALAMSTSLDDFKNKLATDYGIMCNFAVAKDNKQRGRLSFSCTYDGQQHTFKGSSVARDLSFGNVNNVIHANCQQTLDKSKDLKDGQIVSLGEDTKQCYSEYPHSVASIDTGIKAIKADALQVVSPLVNGRCIVSRDGKFAYADKDMNIVSGFYDQLRPFEGEYGVAYRKSDDRYNFINRDGREHFSVWLDSISSPSEGFCVIRSGKMYNHLNMETGQFLSDTWVPEARPFHDGWARIMAGDTDPDEVQGKYNYINTSNQLLTENWYDYCEDFKNGVAVVIDNGVSRAVNGDGDVLGVVKAGRIISERESYEEAPKTGYQIK